MVKELDQTTEKIKNLKREIESLHKDNELSYQELKHNGKNPGNLAAGDSSVTAASRITDMESDEYAKLEEEEEVLMNRINRLEKTIQKDSMKRVINTYVHLCFFRLVVCVEIVWYCLLLPLVMASSPL